MSSSGHFKRTPYVITFKAFALLSFILGVSLLSICLWVIVSLSDHDFDSSHDNTDPTSSKFRIVETIFDKRLLPEEITRGRSSVKDANSPVLVNESSSSSDEADETLKKFRSTWKSVSPFFQGSCGVALILGLLQLISCIAVLTSSSKGASKPIRVKLWKVIHSIISLLLICCFLIPVTIDSNQEDGGISKHLTQVKKHFMKSETNLNHLNGTGTISSIDTESVDNMELLYIALLTDSGGILILTLFLHMTLKHLTSHPSGKTSSVYVS